MPGLLIIAHAPLASSLRTVGAHTFPEVKCVEALDVTVDMPPEVAERRARQLLERVGDPQALVLTDVFGATPCNVAMRLGDGTRVRVVAGVNVPMLWRTLCYLGEPLDSVVNRALAGATQGVMQVAAARPQNQALRPGAHDQDDHNNQQ